MNQLATGYVSIAPGKPVQLGGYADRTAPFTKVADPIEANILLLGSREQRLICVTLDLLYPGDRLRAELQRLLNIAPESLFLAASHTHYAPMTSDGLPALGTPDPEYVESVAARVAEAVRSLEAEEEDCRITYHEARAPYNINRRLKRLRLGRTGFKLEHGQGPNPKGERDEAVRLLRVVDLQRKVRAVLWSYACHPTAYPDRMRVSSDYVGVVRSRIREVYGNIPVLFLQGFSGDLRPPFQARVRDLGSLIRRVCLGPMFATPKEQEFFGWANQIADRVLEGVNSSGAPVEGELRLARQVIPWPGLQTQLPKQLSIHSVKLGNTRILGISAEVVTHYRAIIQRFFPGEHLITAGCIDQTWAYLPSDTMIGERGYEVEDFRRYFSFNSRYVEGVEKQFIAAVYPLAQ